MQNASHKDDQGSSLRLPVMLSEAASRSAVMMSKPAKKSDGWLINHGLSKLQRYSARKIINFIEETETLMEDNSLNCAIHVFRKIEKDSPKVATKFAHQFASWSQPQTCRSLL
mmetsp:Transcript_4297/g.6597  ORF Transcript_4297/g.6597 Transcript_4297/m.6597 type:complete len:113 (+) Transcript_4297:420-758(+)